jgi:hypothetical protein
MWAQVVNWVFCMDLGRSDSKLPIIQ